MRCFFHPQITEVNSIMTLDANDARHLFKVLRAKSGETILLIDGNGTIATARIIENRKLLIIDKKEMQRGKVNIHLYFAPMRKQKLDTMLKQCSECAVASINPVICARSVAHPDTKRWKLLLTEGCKQAKNPFLPQLNETQKLQNALEKRQDSDSAAFFGDQDGKNIKDLNVSGGDISWFVGPEGGFSDGEKQMLRDYGVKPLRIARYTLRAETAAICGITILSNSGN